MSIFPTPSYATPHTMPITYCTRNRTPLYQSKKHHRRTPSWEVESKAFHTTLVLVDRGHAVLLGIFRIAKQHTFVASFLLVQAYTTWLMLC